MDIERLNIASERPEIYEKGDSVMWTDSHIAKKLLEMHLDPDIDAASRKPESIDKTIEFLLGFCHDQQLDILDLGCGPGIYCEKFAEKGHNVTGVDFSQNSIDYAKEQAELKNQSITYKCQDYLELEFREEFDFIILIYTDFGVLLPDERRKLLDNVYKALKPGGLFVFDVLNDKNIEQKFTEQKSWTFENEGFWRPGPYLELINGFHYKKDKVFLKQHTVIDSSENIANYRFWVHAYDEKQITGILRESRFKNIEKFVNILPEKSLWSGENVTFYKAER